VSGSDERDESGDREKQGPGFTVVDKRGQEREPAPEPEAPAEAPAEGAGAGPEAEAGRAGQLPKVDFAALLISLGTSAMMHLGVVADPVTGKPAEKNPSLARQTIDTLEMLQEKTRGNLDPDEDRLLQNLLTELRMRFVETQR